jgi:hemoglobin-like flavoprotein
MASNSTHHHHHPPSLSETTASSHSGKSSLSSSLLGNRKYNSSSTSSSSSNIRKFFRFPGHKTPPEHPKINKNEIHRCPALSMSNPAVAIMFSPTQRQIDLVRISWERVSEKRHSTDDRNVSASHAFGLAFYDALFEMDPECKSLFENVFQQARALTGMISYIARAPTVAKGSTQRPACCGGSGNTTIPLDSPPTSPTTIRDINAKKRANFLSNDRNSTDYEEGDPEWLALQMRELGARHYFYKVQPHHLELVGPAFVAALKKRLGEEYTDEIGEAWIKVCSVFLTVKFSFN